jgi:CheY-like chemotaxis protein
VITDDRMPYISGMDFLRQVHTRHPQLPVILASPMTQQHRRCRRSADPSLLFESHMIQAGSWRPFSGPSKHRGRTSLRPQREQKTGPRGLRVISKAFGFLVECPGQKSCRQGRRLYACGRP